MYKKIVPAAGAYPGLPGSLRQFRPGGPIQHHPTATQAPAATATNPPAAELPAPIVISQRQQGGAGGQHGATIARITFRSARMWKWLVEKQLGRP